MENINDVIYEIQINYINNSNKDVSIYKRIQSNGLQTNIIQVDDIKITEETINGRVLSGRYDENGYYCGYRYDYASGEKLININEETPINDAVTLISKIKMKTDFLSASMALSVILRNDYKVVVLDQGSIDITKVISAIDEKGESCSFQENITISKIEDEEIFKEQHKKRIYKINGDCVVDKFEYNNSDEPKEINSDMKTGQSDEFRNEIKTHLRELVEVVNQSPKNLTELRELISSTQRKL